MLASRRTFLRTLVVLPGLGMSSALWGCVLKPIKSSSRASTPARSLRIASTRDLGTISKPPSVAARDGGVSALLGGQMLWLFGDTLFSPSAQYGSMGRCNTSAVADRTNPFMLKEPVDANGAPYQCIPFTPEEQAYNTARNKPDDRIALWPGSVVTTGKGTGMVFFLKLKVKPGYLNYEGMGIGIARINAGQTVATRLPGLLFPATEPNFVNAMVDGGKVYIYGGQIPPDKGFSVVVACVPLEQVMERSAYRFWNGHDWVSDIKQVSGVLHGVAGAVSVSYNPYLGQYLAVHSEMMSNRIQMHVAPRPEGPWSGPYGGISGKAPASGTVDYAAIEHPELSSQNGRVVTLSYYQTLGALSGELRIVEVMFQ